MLNFRCTEWEGGDRSFSGVCIGCNEEGALNPSWIGINRYSYCWWNDCAEPGFTIEDSYCQINCWNGTRSGTDTCNCNDSWKSWGLVYGCTCPSTTPVEGTSSCSVPTASETVLEVVISRAQIEFYTGTESATIKTPYCGDYEIYQSVGKYVCTRTYCDANYYLGLSGT